MWGLSIPKGHPRAVFTEKFRDEFWGAPGFLRVKHQKRFMHS
jgi:hypothetical protein